MKIVQIQSSLSVKLSQNADIGQKQMQATNTAITFLKGKLPEITPMLTNPVTRNFLIKFFDVITNDPSVMNGFKNALTTIHAAMQNDMAGTTTALTSVSK